MLEAEPGERSRHGDTKRVDTGVILRVLRASAVIFSQTLPAIPHRVSQLRLAAGGHIQLPFHRLAVEFGVRCALGGNLPVAGAVQVLDDVYLHGFFGLLVPDRDRLTFLNHLVCNLLEARLHTLAHEIEGVA